MADSFPTFVKVFLEHPVYTPLAVHTSPRVSAVHARALDDTGMYTTMAVRTLPTVYLCTPIGVYSPLMIVVHALGLAATAPSPDLL